MSRRPHPVGWLGWAGLWVGVAKDVPVEPKPRDARPAESKPTDTKPAEAPAAQRVECAPRAATPDQRRRQLGGQDRLWRDEEGIDKYSNTDSGDVLKRLPSMNVTSRPIGGCAGSAPGTR